jgi:hypothetical protein
LLGDDHPLVRDLERLAVARDQLSVVAAVWTGSLAALLEGSSAAVPLVAAAAVTGLVLVCRVAVLLDSRRTHVLDLISQGRADLPIPVVEHMCVRLHHARRRRQVRSIEALLRAEPERCDLVTSPWRFMRGEVIAPIRQKLIEIGALLREDGAALEGIATMERLLVDGTSSWHGHDPRRLGEDLRRVRLLLGVGSPEH